MFHCILVKFLPSVEDRRELAGQIRELFSAAGDIPGIRSAAVYPSAVDRPNRYDLMIRLDMDRQALDAWDESSLHRRWKEQFGPLLQAKAIFDWEP